MTEKRLKMSQLETCFEFFNFDALPDDEVHRMKSLLKEPCQAVKLPKLDVNDEDINNMQPGVAEFKPATPPTASVGITPPAADTTSPSRSQPLLPLYHHQQQQQQQHHHHSSSQSPILPVVEYAHLQPQQQQQLSPQSAQNATGAHYSQHMYPVVTSVTGAAYIQAGFTLGSNLYMAAPTSQPMEANTYLMPKMMNGMDCGAEGVVDGQVGGAGQGGMVLSPNMYTYKVYTPCPPPPPQHHHAHHHQYVLNAGHAFFTPIAPLHPAARMTSSSSGAEIGVTQHHQHHHHHHHQSSAVASPPTSYMAMVPPSVVAQTAAAPIQLAQPSYDVVVEVDDGEDVSMHNEIVADQPPQQHLQDRYEDADRTEEGELEAVNNVEEALVAEAEPEVIYADEAAVEPDQDQAIDDGYAEEEHPYDSGDDAPLGADDDEGFLDAAPADDGLEDELEEDLMPEAIVAPVSAAAAAAVGLRVEAASWNEQVEMLKDAEPEPEQSEPAHTVAFAPVVPVPEPTSSGPKSWASLFKRQMPPSMAPFPAPRMPAPPAQEPVQQSQRPSSNQQQPPQRSANQSQQPRVATQAPQQQQPPSTNGIGASVSSVAAVATKSPAAQQQQDAKAGVASVKESPTIVPAVATPAVPVVAASPKFPDTRSNGASASNSNDLKELGNILTTYQHDFRNVTFLPRGLSNKGNWCYISSTLQALLACPPFYNLLLKLPSISGLKHGKSLTPITDTMVEFVNEFSPVSLQRMFQAAPANSRRKEELSFGSPFEPVYIYAMLSRLRLNAFEGRQEDAEEFLSCLLNGLHDEMCAALTSVASKYVPENGSADDDCETVVADEDNTDDSWRVMEKRNKAPVTRTTDLPTSPVSQIFCGKIRSALHSSSVSSATLQPFFTLQLDIQSENIRSVKEAMQGLVVKESLQGYHCSKTKQEVTASRQMTLEELPPVLILHLKRFIYDKDGGSMKLSKRVEFPIELELNKELLSPTVKARITGKQRVYRLIAVVYHCGGETGKGHYVADVFHQGSSTWLRADDARLACISENKVLHHPLNCVPYLLFYRRSDTIQLPSYSGGGAGASAGASGGGGGNGNAK